MARLSAIFVLVVALAGCSPQAERFYGTDLTGVQWGRELVLQDPDGRTRSLADFRGKVVAVFFGFVLCPDVCPTALARAAEAKKRLGADGERLQVVFVTVDPERDSAELLRQYTAAFDPSFLGLRGSAEETRRVAAEFKVFYEKVPSGSSYTVNHSTLTYLFDTQGRLRVGVPHAMSAEQLAHDIRLLLKQAS
ncbi:MAG: SCO family protein [Burkholderiales bacterium]|nr:SCO family protein [Burkholderiales bacterium]